MTLEEKFKVGYWIVNNNTKNIFLIKSINNGYCTLEDINGNIISPCLPPSKSESHLWTIQDAKNGDVLASKDGDEILIFRNLDSNISFSSYYNIKGKEELGWSNRSFIPATKEQRDQLEKAMTDAGYTFDFDKKELKKIEDKEYNGEDYGIDSLFHAQRILEKTLGKVDGYQTDDGILSHKCAISAVKKLYEQKPMWSENDKRHWKMCLECVKVCATQQRADFSKTIDWLKSIKQRMEE